MTGSSVLQADSNSTTLMSGTFNVERRIHRKLRLHPDGERARCLPGDQTGLASLGSLSVGAARRPWPTLIEPTSPIGGKTKWRATVPHVRARWRRRPWLSRHTLRKSQCTKRIRYCGQTNGPKVARSAGGDRDDLVDTPALRGGRLVRHGGLLRRQRLGRFFCAGLYDGKSEYRREHHEVC
jgi:hypothetical protein